MLYQTSLHLGGGVGASEYKRITTLRRMAFRGGRELRCLLPFDPLLRRSAWAKANPLVQRTGGAPLAVRGGEGAIAQCVDVGGGRLLVASARAQAGVPVRRGGGLRGNVVSFHSSALSESSRPRRPASESVSAVGSNAGAAPSRSPSSRGQKQLVVVESPAKAVSVQKYLGDGYKVLASYGHVRDLVGKSGSVRPDEDFAMVWAKAGKTAVVRDIVRAARKADVILLATDPDREGEAISWHIVELLKEEGLVTSTAADITRTSSEVSSAAAGTTASAAGVLTVKRVTFTEVTRAAVLAAFAAPRALDAALVDAYLARRALDYLVGLAGSNPPPVNAFVLNVRRPSKP
jgi:hypothetical protein